MHEISISGDFLGWISYLCRMSSVLVISMTRFFIDYCCSRSIVADVSYVYSLTSAISVHVLVAVFGY